MGGDLTAPGVLYAAGRSSGVDTTFVIGDPRFDEIRLSESPENTLSRARWQQFQAASSSSKALRQQAGSAYRAASASRSIPGPGTASLLDVLGSRIPSPGDPHRQRNRRSVCITPLHERRPAALFRLESSRTGSSRSLQLPGGGAFCAATRAFQSTAAVLCLRAGNCLG